MRRIAGPRRSLHAQDVLRLKQHCCGGRSRNSGRRGAVQSVTGVSGAAGARRCALHWDNAGEARELQIRPLGPGWEWSGAFAIPEREEYVGLRIRNR
jgi:hypothetical protein